LNVERRETIGTAIRLSHDIKLASWLGKHAVSERGRRRAYQVKAAKLSQALTHFDKYFCILWVERHHSKFEYLLTARLADMSLVHIPWQHLSLEAQLCINLSSLYVRRAPLQARAVSVAAYANSSSVNLHQQRVA
jgi:hypothetical protein